MLNNREKASLRDAKTAAAKNITNFKTFIMKTFCVVINQQYYCCRV
jgi:hypothetical protein